MAVVRYTGTAPVVASLVTAYLTGTQVLATLYADDLLTPLGNPFTADALTGLYTFWASDAVGYDVVIGTVGTPTPPIVGSDVSFGTLGVQGGENVVAAIRADAMAFVPGAGIVLTGSNAGRTITIAATGGGGTGDVVGPAGATADDLAVFDTATGKLIKDGGSTIAQVVSAAVSAAQSAILPIDLAANVGVSLLPFANLTAATGASILLGRGSAGGGGSFEEITLGANLTLTGTVLSATDTDTGITQLTSEVTAGPGSGSQAATLAANLKIGTFGITIDGAGVAITSGVKGFYRVPFSCTLTGWTLLSVDAAATAGAIKLDVWKKAYGAGYPPADANSITNGHEPEIPATGNAAEDADLSDWTSVAVTAGDVIGYNVDSAATITKALFQLAYTRTA